MDKGFCVFPSLFSSHLGRPIPAHLEQPSPFLFFFSPFSPADRPGPVVSVVLLLFPRRQTRTEELGVEPPRQPPPSFPLNKLGFPLALGTLAASPSSVSSPSAPLAPIQPSYL